MNLTSRLQRLEQRRHPQETMDNQRQLLLLHDPVACALACDLIAEVSNNPDATERTAAAGLETIDARLEELAA